MAANDAVTAHDDPPVVVGIDGSPSALDATRWAAEEAGRCGTWLRIVFCDVFGLAYLPDLPSVRIPEGYSQAMAEQAETWLHRAKEVALAAAPEVRARTFIRAGGPLPALVEESRHARLTVVGSRGLGGFAGLVVGSVAMGLAAHGHGSAAVIRTPVDASAEGPVVVGVGAQPDEVALRAAYEAAASRGAPLEVVHAWRAAMSERGLRAWRSQAGAEAVQRAEDEALAEVVAGWADKYPDVEVRRVVIHGRAATALVERATRGRLLVVGARRSRLGMLGLGSTSRQLVHEAPCPLLLAR